MNIKDIKSTQVIMVDTVNADINSIVFDGKTLTIADYRRKALIAFNDHTKESEFLEKIMMETK